MSDITTIWTNEGWLLVPKGHKCPVGIFGGHAGALFEAGHWLGDCRTHDGNAGVPHPHHGVIPTWHKWRRKMPKGVIVHSGRDSQYCPAAYLKLFSKYQLTCSTCAPEGMGKKGDCYDNAAIESRNHSFKVEAIHGERVKTRPETKRQAFRIHWSVLFMPFGYNRKRLRSRRGYLIPDTFEAKKVA
ncbi:MAG: hypothetical protein ABL933_04510 [Methyloglobulus sp.]|nr:hypothetical protein [Methyloglobulus sp.]